tara:strand:+ start:120 stop:425 length:306 start_codon:yes stop_codon:yes gene_type:complete
MQENKRLTIKQRKQLDDEVKTLALEHFDRLENNYHTGAEGYDEDNLCDEDLRQEERLGEIPYEIEERRYALRGFDNWSICPKSGDFIFRDITQEDLDKHYG